MLTVVIQDEMGNDVSDPIFVSTNTLVRQDDPRFSCIRFIDPFGDTVFNSLQFECLLEDLHLLRDSCSNSQDKLAINQVETLVKKCQETVHLYLKIIGD